jgi:hypothetical protein
MQVKTFLETAGNFEERDILKKFYQGLLVDQTVIPFANQTVNAKISLELNYSACEVAVLYGSWKPRDRDHHVVRNSIVNEAQAFVVIETALLTRKVFEENQYYRIGVNGFLNNSGTFTNNEIDDTRFNQLGLSWPNWQNNPDGYILLMLQLPGDASLRGIDMYEWCKFAIKQIRKVSDRPIRIRSHPLYKSKENDDFQKFVFELAMNSTSNIMFSQGSEISLADDLMHAYCTVGYSTGSSIDSILCGIPAVACDPGNFAYEVSTNFLDSIEDLKQPDQSVIMPWLYKLAYSQWTLEEMANGQAWKHIKPLINFNNTPRKKK